MSRFGLHHLLAIFPACFAGAATASPQLERAPAHYLVLRVRAVNLENCSIAEPGCNVGGNCPNPRADNRCGTLRLEARRPACPASRA